MLPETLYFNELMLVDFNLELYNSKTKDPFSSIAWYKAENEYFHPLSLSMALETYGYHKLGEVLPLKDYLEMPNVVVEEILESMTRGMRKREESEAAKAQARDKANPPHVDKQLERELRKAGVKLDT